MLSCDEDIKRETPESTCDEVISIREVCLDDKFDRRFPDFHGEAVLPSSGRNDLDLSQYLRSLGLESGLRDLDDEDLQLIEESDNSTSYDSRADVSFLNRAERSAVSSTSTNAFLSGDRPSNSKVSASDPRSRLHYVKYLKRQGRTVKLWECGICSREFQHQYTLMRHLPTHTDERNFHCTACGKSFRQLSTLSQHKAIHSTDRPYSCEVCNKTFNRVSTLISHRKTHSDQKPYRCHLCPKGFHQKGNLRNHLFTHTNERPYRCNLCLKGFNQQSNLVCHKNKAHPEDTTPVVNQRRQVPRRRRSAIETKHDTNGSQESEVSSSVGPYLPTIENPSTSWVPYPTPELWSTPILSNGAMVDQILSNGVLVDQISTYHMGVALSMKQTPFALIKPDYGTPVLVKVVDAKLPDGKQMLVPATAEDLRVGGKIILNSDGTSEPLKNPPSQESNSVQIRVPVVATVVPRVRPGGGLRLDVEEPHHVYNASLNADGDVQVESCIRPPAFELPPRKHPPMPPLQFCPGYDRTAAGRISPSCSLPPPAPSPPLDLISLDLFEPIECIPMGPQVIPVENITPPSEDSDVFISEFEESIPLSD